MSNHWKKGSFLYKNQFYEYCMKQFELPSEFGIDNGRISKLSMKRNEKEVLNYDRGWDITPVDADAKGALEAFLKAYN